MIYFTLNMAETKSGRVGTVTNRLEIGFLSRISHRSRGEPRCRRATWHNQRATCVQGSWVEARVIGSLAGLAPFAGDGSFAGNRPAQLKEKCRWAWLGVSVLDWACGSRVESIALGRNWAYAFWAEATGPWEPSSTRLT